MDGSLRVGNFGLSVSARQPTCPIDLNESPPVENLDSGPFGGGSTDQPLILNVRPHYRYRLDYLTTSESGQGAPTQIDQVDMSQLDSAARSYVAAGRAYRNANDGGYRRPACVGYNNIGEIQFAWLTNEKRVNHTLYWRQPGEAVPFWARYNISLMIDDLEYPPIKADREGP
jgi:hypothetical protein